MVYTVLVHVFRHNFGRFRLHKTFLICLAIFVCQRNLSCLTKKLKKFFAYKLIRNHEELLLKAGYSERTTIFVMVRLVRVKLL